MSLGRQGEKRLDAHTLYEGYGSAIFGFCLRNLGNREEAEDVVQDTFLNAWLALRRGVQPEAPQAWLLTIARNLCVSRHRAKAARIQTAQLDETRGQAAPAQKSADDLIELRALLRRLPEQQRRAFLLYEVKGLAHREVAAELGLSYAAVATLVFRARRALARSLAEGDRIEAKPASSWWASMLGLLEPVFGAGAPAKLAVALSAAPLALIPAAVAPRSTDHVRATRAPAPHRVILPTSAKRQLLASRPTGAVRDAADRAGPAVKGFPSAAKRLERDEARSEAVELARTLGLSRLGTGDSDHAPAGSGCAESIDRPGGDGHAVLCELDRGGPEQRRDRSRAAARSAPAGGSDSSRLAGASAGPADRSRLGRAALSAAVRWARFPSAGAGERPDV